MKKNRTTHKKQKLVGFRELTDVETGEVYPMQLHVVEEKDFNFHKVWLGNLAHSLNKIANQKLKLTLWIIDNLNVDNLFIMTQREIANRTGMSLETVNRTLQILCEADDTGVTFLQKVQVGVYRINPEIIFKGKYSNRMGICFQYRQTDDKNKTVLQDDEAEEDENLQIKFEVEVPDNKDELELIEA